PSTTTVWFGLMPSFLASGVPEYPAMRTIMPGRSVTAIPCAGILGRRVVAGCNRLGSPRVARDPGSVTHPPLPHNCPAQPGSACYPGALGRLRWLLIGRRPTPNATRDPEPPTIAVERSLTLAQARLPAAHAHGPRHRPRPRSAHHLERRRPRRRPGGP